MPASPRIRRGPASSRARKLAREAKADLLVAVGGGSAIDATKVMLIALWQNATTIEDLDLYRAGRPKEGAAPPSEAIKPPADAIRMIAVPTTLSAAEFNAFAGISDPRQGIKESFGHRLIVPRVIVLDPAATLATPMDLMLSTGLKAVDHAVERLCSQQANPFALGTATEALKLLARALPAHKAQPDDMETRHEPAVRHVAVDRRRHLGRGRRREPRHRPCAGRRLPRAARPYLVRDAAFGAALEPAGQRRAPEAGERGVRQARCAGGRSGGRPGRDARPAGTA